APVPVAATSSQGPFVYLISAAYDRPSLDTYMSLMRSRMTSSRSFALPRDAIVTAFVLVAGGLAVIFDGTIMSIALNSLSVDLRVPISTIQWVTTGYLLALAVAIPVVGWAQARFGGKRVWMSALTLFMLASVACSFAGDATM